MNQFLAITIQATKINLIPILSIIGALFTSIIGGIVVILGNKYIFNLGVKEKYQEKFITKKIQAYEELYRLVINSRHTDLEDTKEQSRIWVSKYGLYLSQNIISAYFNFIHKYELYMQDKTEEAETQYSLAISTISAIIRIELYLDKIIDPTVINKLLR